MNVFLIGLGIVFALGFFAGRISSPTPVPRAASEVAEEETQPEVNPSPTSVVAKPKIENQMAQTREQALLQQIAQLNRPCPPTSVPGNADDVYVPESEYAPTPEEEPDYMEYPDDDGGEMGPEGEGEL